MSKRRLTPPLIDLPDLLWKVTQDKAEKGRSAESDLEGAAEEPAKRSSGC